MDGKAASTGLSRTEAGYFFKSCGKIAKAVSLRSNYSTHPSAGMTIHRVGPVIKAHKYQSPEPKSAVGQDNGRDVMTLHLHAKFPVARLWDFSVRRN